MDELEPEPAALAEFEVAADPEGDVIVTIRGELDITAVDALAERVAPWLEDGSRGLVVEVSGLRFADSSAIALWVRWASEAERFELRSPPSLLRRVIYGMGLAKKLGLSR